MTLSDIYPHASPDKDFFEEYQYLKNVNPPTIEEIGAYQVTKIQKNLSIDPKTLEMIEKINADGKMMTIGDDSNGITQAIANIEKTFGHWSLTDNNNSAQAIQSTISSDVLANIKVDLQKYETLLNNLKSVYQDVSKYSSDMELKNQLLRIEKVIQQLEHDISAYKLGTFEADPNAQQGQGYLQHAQMIGSRLKGAYLEAAGTAFFNSVVPKNIEVATTGKVLGWSYDVLGNKKTASKMLRTDIMAFDLSEDIKIKYEVGTGKDKKVVEGTIKEMLDTLKTKNTTIDLSITDYSDIQKALVFGAQAKAGKGQAIFNPVKLSLDQLNLQTTLGDDGDQYAKALISFFDMLGDKSQEKTTMRTKWIGYDAMFNFLLGRHAANIIGQENHFVVTRDGVQRVDQYMENQYKEHQKIIRMVGNRLDITSDARGIPRDIKYAKAEKA